jgi:hypothetical protein
LANVIWREIYKRGREKEENVKEKGERQKMNGKLKLKG